MAAPTAKGNNGKGEALKSFVRPTLTEDIPEIWEMLQDVSTFYPKIQARDLFETLRKEKGLSLLSCRAKWAYCWVRISDHIPPNTWGGRLVKLRTWW